MKRTGHILPALGNVAQFYRDPPQLQVRPRLWGGMTAFPRGIFLKSEALKTLVENKAALVLRDLIITLRKPSTGRLGGSVG